MEGYLKKMSSKLVKKWQKRWFSLDRSVLTYHEKSPQEEEGKQGPGSELMMRDLLSINIDPKCQLVLVLRIKSSKAGPKELRLRCPDKDSYSSWLSCFAVFLPEPTRAGCVIPTVFARPIWELTTYLTRSETAATDGIFRTTGVKADIDSVIAKILLGRSQMNSILSKYQTKSLASVLKRLIDKMPHTLLSERIYNEFIRLYKSEHNEETHRQVRKLLRKLPQQSALFLHHICLTLKHISDTIGNRMNAKNLSTLFGPMFVSRGKSAEESLVDYEFLIQLFEDLIENCDYIFPQTRPEFAKFVPRLEIALSIRLSPTQGVRSSNLEERKSFFCKHKFTPIRTNNVECPPVQEFMLNEGRETFYLPAVSGQKLRSKRSCSTPAPQPVIPWTRPSSPTSESSGRLRRFGDKNSLITPSFKRPRALTHSVSKKNTFPAISEEKSSPKLPCISKSAWDEVRTPHLSSSTLFERNDSEFFKDSMPSLFSGANKSRAPSSSQLTAVNDVNHEDDSFKLLDLGDV